MEEEYGAHQRNDKELFDQLALQRWIKSERS
jgi:hypothetical protein